LTSLLAAALQGTSQPAEPDEIPAQRQPGDVHEDITGDEAAPALPPELQELTAAESKAAAGAGIPSPESDEAGRTEADSQQELPPTAAAGEADMPPKDTQQAPPVQPGTASILAEPVVEAAPGPLSDGILLSDAQPAATESGATGLEMQGDE
jgi:hypothetical protein